MNGIVGMIAVKAHEKGLELALHTEKGPYSLCVNIDETKKSKVRNMLDVFRFMDNEIVPLTVYRFPVYENINRYESYDQARLHGLKEKEESPLYYAG